MNDIDVSQITDMTSLFINSYNFDGDISQWNVSNVKDMKSMFNHSIFNVDISNWDVSNVTDMRYMFADSKFDGDISQWDVNENTNTHGMFRNSILHVPKWYYRTKY